MWVLSAIVVGEWNVNYSDSKGDWVWNVGFNLSHVKNEILEMGGLEEAISGQTINRIGNPIGAYFGYKAIVCTVQKLIYSVLIQKGKSLNKMVWLLNWAILCMLI